jgi:hypothetical protein
MDDQKAAISGVSSNPHPQVTVISANTAWRKSNQREADLAVLGLMLPLAAAVPHSSTGLTYRDASAQSRWLGRKLSRAERDGSWHVTR